MRGKAFGTVASPVRQLGRATGGDGISRIIAALVSNTTTTAQSITAPVAGTYRLVLVGPGGTGLAQSFISANQPGATSGGGSGGIAVSKTFSMTAGQALSVTLGQSSAASGSAGTAPTTASLPDGTALSAGPGQGGQSSGNNNNTVAGGLGGTASGGEFNFTGGRGGGVSAGVLVDAPREVRSVAGGSVSLPDGSVGAALTNLFAGGGGNLPTATGFIPPSSGSDGFARSDVAGGEVVTIPSPDLNNLGNVGKGGGAIATNTGVLTPGRGGYGAAILLLEVPA